MVNARICLDLDGVLADFNAGYFSAFNIQPSHEADNVDWTLVEQHGSFFRSLPVMDGAHRLVAGVRAHGYEPTILTGIPRSVPDAAEQKREWVAEHLGLIKVITCRSRHKYAEGGPGAILIDDWPKYRNLWEQSGGVWITHISTLVSLADLDIALEATR